MNLCYALSCSYCVVHKSLVDLLWQNFCKFCNSTLTFEDKTEFPLISCLLFVRYAYRQPVVIRGLGDNSVSNDNILWQLWSDHPRLQQIQNSLACAVVKAPKSSHITPILRSLHWLEITERIEYKLVSLTYKVLTTIQLSYLHNLITVQPPRSTQSSFLVTLARPSTSSSLRITDHSFHYASPGLWNELPAFLCQPRTDIQLSNFDSASSMSGTSSIGFIDSPLSSSVTPSLFHSRLKTFLFTARCYVRSSQVSVLLKRLNIGSHK